MKTKTTGTAPERRNYARSKRPTGNTSAARLGLLMESRRSINGLLLRLCRQLGISGGDLTKATAEMRLIVQQDIWNRPNPRARLKERREMMRGEMERTFRKVILMAMADRTAQEPQP